VTEFLQTVCRVCHHSCPVLVEFDKRRPVAVHGDRGNTVYRGYTCVKGPLQLARYDSPQRLRNSLKRDTAGEFRPIDVDRAA
jgi:anaerobic selenocysteine-containing dehydrogenase